MCLNAEIRSRGRAILAQIRSASFRDWVTAGRNDLDQAEMRTAAEWRRPVSSPRCGG